MSSRTLTLLAIGLILALCLVYAGSFLVPPGLSVGPLDHRALQHLLGFFGFAFIVQGIVSCCYSRESYVLHALVLGGAIVVSWSTLIFPNTIVLSGEIGALAALIRNPGTIWFLCALAMARVFRTDKRWLVAFGGLLLCLVVSLYWELYQQPVVGVYNGPPRHEIQAPQVAADIIAIALAFGMLWGITLRSTGSARTAAQAG